MNANFWEMINRWSIVAVALILTAVGPIDSYGQEAAPAESVEAAPAATPDTAAATTDDSDDGRVEDLFIQGREALLTGKYDEAIKLLGEAVKAEPSKTGYRLSLARAYRYAGKTKEAAVQLEEILKIAADHIEAGQTLAEIYTDQERFEDVVRVLKPLLEYRHDYPTYHMLAEAEYRLSNQKQARSFFEEAIKLNPNSASDNYQLGNIYLSENGFARAAESYQAAIRLGMDSPVLRYKLGSAHFNLRNYFGRVTQRTIQSGEVGTISGPYYLIEAVSGSKDRFLCAPEASAIYQIARAIADGIEDRVDIHVLRGTIFLNARRYAQAYTIFEELQPRIPDADKALFHYYFAQAAFGTGRYQRYLELLQEAIRLDPDSYQSTLVDAYLKVADQYNQEGELDKYIELLGQAVAENPTSASLHLRLGDALHEADRTSEAVVQWRMVLDLQADHPKRLELLSRIQTAHLNLKPVGGDTSTPTPLAGNSIPPAMTPTDSSSALMPATTQPAVPGSERNHPMNARPRSPQLPPAAAIPQQAPTPTANQSPFDPPVNPMTPVQPVAPQQQELQQTIEPPPATQPTAYPNADPFGGSPQTPANPPDDPFGAPSIPDTPAQ